ARIFCSTSRQAPGLGSRKGWTSPDQMKTRWPSICRERLSQVSSCAAPARAGGQAAASRPRTTPAAAKARTSVHVKDRSEGPLERPVGLIDLHQVRHEVPPAAHD